MLRNIRASKAITSKGTRNRLSGARLLLLMIAALVMSLSSYHVATVWALALLPALYLRCPTRFVAWVFIITFYLGLNVEEIGDCLRFFHWGKAACVGVWLCHAFLLSLVWLPYWSTRKSHRYLVIKTFIFMGLLVLPPLGLFVWIQPIASSGALFPGLGFLGLLLTCGVMSVLVVVIAGRPTQRYAWALVALLLISLLANGWVLMRPAPRLPHYRVVNTHYGGAPADAFAIVMREQQLIAQVREAIAQGARRVVLPENMTDWANGTRLQWQDTLAFARQHHALVFIGYDRLLAGSRHEAGVAVLGLAHPLFIPERQPMPLGEWRPWASHGAHYDSHWFSRGDVSLPGVRVAILVCFEQMVPYPLLASFFMRHKPQVIVSVANQWFSSRRSYLKQRVTADSLARLFGVPLVVATNW